MRRPEERSWRMEQDARGFSVIVVGPASRRSSSFNPFPDAHLMIRVKSGRAKRGQRLAAGGGHNGPIIIAIIISCARRSSF